MDKIKKVVYLEYAILSLMLTITLLPLFDAITSIFIILFLFILAMTLLYFRVLFIRNKILEF